MLKTFFRLVPGDKVYQDTPYGTVVYQVTKVKPRAFGITLFFKVLEDNRKTYPRPAFSKLGLSDNYMNRALVWDNVERTFISTSKNFKYFYEKFFRPKER